MYEEVYSYSAHTYEEVYSALQLSLPRPRLTPGSTKPMVSSSHQRRAWAQSPGVILTTYSVQKSCHNRPLLCAMTKILSSCRVSHDEVLPSENVLGTNIYMMPLSLNWLDCYVGASWGSPELFTCSACLSGTMAHMKPLRPVYDLSDNKLVNPQREL